MKDRKLIFVYNAKSGRIHGLIDLLHKNISPGTYPCHLCAVTYNNKGMDPEWKSFTDKLPYTVLFLHKDELISMYGKQDYALPALYADLDGSLQVIMSPQLMAEAKDVQSLIALTNQVIAEKMLS